MTEIDEETFDSVYKDALGGICPQGHHNWKALICSTCGGYQGDECLVCGAWHDGGETMVAQAIWCNCPGIFCQKSDDGNHHWRDNGEETWCDECGISPNDVV